MNEQEQNSDLKFQMRKETQQVLDQVQVLDSVKSQNIKNKLALTAILSADKANERLF